MGGRFSGRIFPPTCGRPRSGWRLHTPGPRQAEASCCASPALESLEEIAKASRRSKDLAVTDYNMPGMSGLEVAREVRTIRANLPVAIASGFIDDTLRSEAVGAGVRELIFKADAVD